MKQKVDMQRIAGIRSDLHDEIFIEVDDTEHTALRVLREPNQYRRQPASKMIIVVRSEEQAHALKKKCLNLIENANRLILNEINGSTYKHYELKYSISIIHSVDDMMLTVSDAQRRYKMNGITIKSKLREVYGEKYGNDIEDCITGLDDGKNYIFAESTGKSYRLTYYDGFCRKQTSVGNLLIVVSASGVRILDTPLRKRRNDKKKALYCLDIKSSQILIYPA